LIVPEIGVIPVEVVIALMTTPVSTPIVAHVCVASCLPAITEDVLQPNAVVVGTQLSDFVRVEDVCTSEAG
jgi:hypothetical protein